MSRLQLNSICARHRPSHILAMSRLQLNSICARHRPNHILAMSRLQLNSICARHIPVMTYLITLSSSASIFSRVLAMLRSHRMHSAINTHCAGKCSNQWRYFWRISVVRSAAPRGWRATLASSSRITMGWRVPTKEGKQRLSFPISNCN